MNTKTEIDFEKILKEKLVDYVCNNVDYNEVFIYYKKEVIEAMKEVSKQVRDIILREAADKAKLKTHAMCDSIIDKSSIINLANSEELNKKLGL